MMQIDWVCNEEEGGALGWPSAFWSEQMPGWECYLLRYKTKEYRSRSLVGWGGVQRLCDLFGVW